MKAYGFLLAHGYRIMKGYVDAEDQEEAKRLIMAKITNDSREGKTVHIKQGEAFMQGVITQFFKTDDDDSNAIRNGGFGSTSR